MDYHNIKNLPKFSFLNEKNHIISLVGAGGKTSLMYSMANHYSKQGYKVLATTTTKIRKPKHIPIINNIHDLQKQWQMGNFAVAGKEIADEKLSMIEYDLLKEYIKKADIVLIEADGAKEMPCKVPSEKEPVIILECDIVVGVIGLDSLNKPLNDVCFRIDNAVKLLNKQKDDILIGDDICKILLSQNGMRKNVANRDYYVILNKCSDDNITDIEHILKRLCEYLPKNKIGYIMKEAT